MCPLNSVFIQLGNEYQNQQCSVRCGTQIPGSLLLSFGANICLMNFPANCSQRYYIPKIGHRFLLNIYSNLYYQFKPSLKLLALGVLYSYVCCWNMYTGF